jgi:hypothetical protein
MELRSLHSVFIVELLSILRMLDIKKTLDIFKSTPNLDRSL